MRREGAKLPIDCVMVTRPTRGWLIVRPGVRRARDGQRESYVEAVLQTEDGRVPMFNLPTLYHVRVRRWEGHQLVLLGEEYVPGSGVPGRYWPQTWWVRIVERRDAPPSPVPDQVSTSRT